MSTQPETQKIEENVLNTTENELCQYYQNSLQFFDQLPNCITTIKKDYILDKATVNTRFVLLCLGALGTAAATARFNSSFIKVTRNAVIAYIGAGLFVVPEKMKNKTIKNIMIIIIYLVLFTIFGGIFGLISYLSDSLIIGTINTIICFWLLAKFICQLLVFPGSKRLFQKFQNSNQSEYEASCIQKQLQIIVNALNGSVYETKILQQSIQYLHLIITIYEKIELQTTLQKQFGFLISLLKEQFDPNLLNQIKEKQNESKFKEFKQTAQNIIQFLSKYLDQMKQYHKRFVLNDFLGTSQEQKLELQLRYPNCKQLLLKNNNRIIDTLFIINNNNLQNTTTILFCNPNAGQWESMFFSCIWFEIYRQKKCNVITYNYSSYGESKGILSPDYCIQDAEYLVDYFREKYGIKKIGSHGQSFGGMIAASVAYSKQLNFVIADRSFSSLGQVASVGFGSFGRFLFNLICYNWDQPSYKKFYQFKGPKLIIQDPIDEIIPYESQLLASVIRCHYCDFQHNWLTSLLDQESSSYQKFFYQKILNQKELQEMSNAFNQIFKYFQQIKENEILQQQQQNKQQQKYVEILIDDELDDLKLIINQLEGIFSQVQYSYNNILQVLNFSPTPAKISLFFGGCFIFGVANDKDFIECYQNYKEDIDYFLQQQYEIKQWAQVIQGFNNQIKENVQLINILIDKIITNFKKLKENNFCMEMTGYQSFINEKYHVGELLSVSCGHNGNPNFIEQKYFLEFFNKYQLLN